MRWTGAAWAAAGLIAGGVLAPAGAGADGGDPAILGAVNSSGLQTTVFENEDWRESRPALEVRSGFLADEIESPRVLAQNSGLGSSVYATSANRDGTVVAQNGGTGSAFYAKQGSTTATGPIIIGSGGPKGRGALFRGGAAQVRLEAAAAGTHPASGQLGDLFLDAGGRLWLCKGGTAWKQIG